MSDTIRFDIFSIAQGAQNRTALEGKVWVGATEPASPPSPAQAEPVYRCKHIKIPGDGGFVDGCGWQGPESRMREGACPSCGSAYCRKVEPQQPPAEPAQAEQWVPKVGDRVVVATDSKATALEVVEVDIPGDYSVKVRKVVGYCETYAPTDLALAKPQQPPEAPFKVAADELERAQKGGG